MHHCFMHHQGRKTYCHPTVMPCSWNVCPPTDSTSVEREWAENLSLNSGSPWRWFGSPTSLVAQMVKRLSTMWETWVQSLGQEDPLEKEMAIHSSTIAWRIPWTEEPGRLQSMGLQRVRHDWATSLHLHPVIQWATFTDYFLCSEITSCILWYMRKLWHRVQRIF